MKKELVGDDVETMLNQYAVILQKIFWYVYLQVLWILFTLIGFLFFGIFPATYALLVVVKQQDTSTTRAFHAFRRAYLESFFVINRAATIWLVMILLLSINIFFLPESQQIIRLAATSMLVFLLLCLVHFLNYFQTDAKVIEQIKRSFLLTFINPRKNIGYILLVIMLGAAFYIIPGITCFFAVSVSAKAISWIKGTDQTIVQHTKIS
ncbi:YesL family protein [Gracilibacillus sp. D59]|uniref:YesL family protein n=1 Tax=Gracilibacillus sp. D59 TaxID=3457434 RepID=UPI003FCC787B